MKCFCFLYFYQKHTIRENIMILDLYLCITGRFRIVEVLEEALKYTSKIGWKVWHFSTLVWKLSNTTQNLSLSQVDSILALQSTSLSGKCITWITLIIYFYNVIFIVKTRKDLFSSTLFSSLPLLCIDQDQVELDNCCVLPATYPV